MESLTSSGSIPGGMNSWNSKEGGGLVVVLEAWVEWERGWRKEKREGGVGVLEMVVPWRITIFRRNPPCILSSAFVVVSESVCYVQY